jgi:hypothetical protein
MKEVISKGIQFLLDEYEGFVAADTMSWDEQDHVVDVCLPFSEESILIPEKEFPQFIEECRSLTIDQEHGWVVTAKRAIRIVRAVSFKAEGLTFYFQKDISIALPGGEKVRFSPRNFFAGFAAFKINAYHADAHPPEDYPSVELEFASGKPLSREDADSVFDSFLFELAASQDIVFQKAPFVFYDSDDPFGDAGEPALSFRPLEPFNEGMRLFNAAVTVDDPELRLLSLYKVLEYFAPIVFSIDSHDALRRKLDSSKALQPDGDFLASIFELMRSTDKRRTDKEMIKALFERCVDVIDLSQSLPKELRREVSYSDKKTDTEAYARSVAEVLVATRNQLAHAKSNYESQGNEVRKESLAEFNEFLRVACVQVIRWYNRLPNHLRSAQ